MRHTFISMHVAKYRSMGESALHACNSESSIRKHYLDPKIPAEAEQFLGILPTVAPAVVASPVATATVTPLETSPLPIAA